jgi:hypothetical protein
VTAGSLWTSLADIIERPSNVLQLLGESLPTVNGYFVSLLVTKILAGLPIVFLRVGALSRMMFLRAFFSEKKLTQRELDAVYRPDNVMYGWEVRRRNIAVNGEARRFSACSSFSHFFMLYCACSITSLLQFPSQLLVIVICFTYACKCPSRLLFVCFLPRHVTNSFSSPL